MPVDRYAHPAHRVYDSPEWRTALAIVKATGPTCGICGHPGSDSLDHRLPLSQHPDLAFDPANWQPCHGSNGPGCTRCPTRNGKQVKCNQAKSNRLNYQPDHRSQRW